LRRKCRDDRGAVAVEFALISIPLILLIAGIVQFGLAYFAQVNVTQAARSAARYGAICGSTATCTVAQVQQNAVDAAPGAGLTSSAVTVRYCAAGTSPGSGCASGNCPSGSTQATYFEYVTVSVPYNFTFGILRGGGPLSITITGKASLPCGG
jgi:Flp pilus assembly protein TadG